MKTLITDAFDGEYPGEPLPMSNEVFDHHLQEFLKGA